MFRVSRRPCDVLYFQFSFARAISSRLRCSRRARSSSLTLVPSQRGGLNSSSSTSLTSISDFRPKFFVFRSSTSVHWMSSPTKWMFALDIQLVVRVENPSSSTLRRYGSILGWSLGATHLLSAGGHGLCPWVNAHARRYLGIQTTIG